MSTPLQSGPSSTPAIHYAEVYPVISTLCGVTERPMPSTSRWAFVTCLACLRAGAAWSPEARARLADGCPAPATTRPEGLW